MSPLVQKEVRALLPPWLLALVLAIVPVWLVWPGPLGIYAASPGYLVQAPFALGVLLLCLTPFGQELNWGTFSLLLAQPVSRARIWRVKTLLLAAALLLVFAAYVFSNQLRVNHVVVTAGTTELRNLVTRASVERQVQVIMTELRHNVLVQSLMVGGLGALAGFGGGLWTTLLFRQVSAAFWFTLLVPVGLALLGGLVGDWLTCLVLGGYAVAGFVWARRQFQQVQDTQWTGGVVSLPAWGASAVAGGKLRKRRALRALLKKEFQAQYINLLLAGGLLVIHLVVVLIRRLSFDYLNVHRTLAMTLESFPVLWLAIPLLVGSVAVAEERKLGMYEAISCLPVSRRLQFAVKLALVLALGFILGAVVPVAIEQLAAAPGRASETSIAFGIGFASVPLVRILVIGAIGISLLACYGSSLTRNTLQALGAGVLTCVVASLVGTVAAYPVRAQDMSLWGFPLLMLIMVPVMILAVIVLAYRNYRRLQVTARVWGRNALILLVLLLGTTAVTSAVYHRFWEIWMPLEPPHSRMALATDNQMPDTKLSATASRVAAILSDHRLWLRQRPVTLLKVVQSGNGGAAYFIPQFKGRISEGFLPGSNWHDVAATDFGCFAVRTDGSLWDLSAVQPGGRRVESQLKRVGNDNDWKTIAAAGPHYTGLKSGGTLWEWGFHWTPQGQTPTQPGSSTPTRVGTDTNWIAIADTFQSTVAVKTDGTIWRWGWVQYWSNDSFSKPQLVSEPAQWLAFSGSQRPVCLAFDGYGLLAVCDDHTLWIGGNLLSRLLVPAAAERARTEMVQWGTANDWKQIAFNGIRSIIAVKQNGQLLQWNPTGPFWGRYASQMPLGQLSDYAFWSSVCGDGFGFLALGCDDKLCVWGNPHQIPQYWWYGPDPHWLLLPSRIHARELANLAR